MWGMRSNERWRGCGFPNSHFFVYRGQSHNMSDLKGTEIAEGEMKSREGRNLLFIMVWSPGVFFMIWRSYVFIWI